jgi:hypothetical protein
MRGFQIVVLTCAIATSLLAANGPFAGTWKLNAGKSKFATGTAMTDATVTFEMVGDQWKRVATGTDPDGKQFNENSTIAWDGKDHAIDEPGMTVAVNTLNDRAIRFILKHEGKVVVSGRLVVSKDGKTMTAYEKGEDMKGRKLDNVEVFDKQ